MTFDDDLNSPNPGIHGPDEDDKSSSDIELPQDENSSNYEDEPCDEAHSLIEIINECITSLFRVGILVRKVATRDRFQQALRASNMSFPENFDIDYVRNKHPKISPGHAAARLGSAIAKRRQFIKYCRDHRARLGADDELAPSVVPAQEETRTVQMSSKASTFDHLNTNVPNVSDLATVLDQEEDDVSVMSVSTTADSFSTLKLPRLADLSTDDGPFECPICFTLQSFKREAAWV